MDVRTLSQLIKENAFLESGGKDEYATDKLNKGFGILRQTGLDINKIKNDAVLMALKKKEVELASRKDAREEQETNSKLNTVSNALVTPKVRGILGEAEAAPIPVEDLVSGKLDTRQKAIDTAQNVALQGQQKYGTLTPDQYKDVKDSGGGADFKTVSDLRQEFINRPEVKEYVIVNTQVKAMDALLNSALAGDMNNQAALDQGLITMYNKLTDPQSVVRESEYARTPENLPMTNRVIGAIEKLKQGGAGLTNDDRKALVLGAKIIGDVRGKQFNQTREQYNVLSGKYGIQDTSVVTGTLPEFGGFPGQEVKRETRNPTEIVTQAVTNPNSGLTQQQRYLIENKRASGVTDEQLAEVIQRWLP